ncbi:MAG TPA: acyltransferase [Candidatus Hydrogenedentes bacterium]|nr:acyltransferase [Candidatus Hydrogenedentota bacterium]HQM47754.1 acyltransferase [Candidatus Hydrogenedentota bacterium]
MPSLKRKSKTMLLMLYLAIANHLVNRIPLNGVRNFLYRRLYGIRMGRGSVIHMGLFVEKPRWISIGEHTLINPNCILDGRSRLTIGNNVDIAMQVAIFTLAHDIRSADYEVKGAPVVIEDRVTVFSRATILPGVRIGEGAVVAAGTVVTRDVDPYTVVAGNPARKIGVRPRDLTYTLHVTRYFH